MSIHAFGAVVLAAVYAAVVALRGLALGRDPRDADSWILWRRAGWRRRRD